MVKRCALPPFLGKYNPFGGRGLSVLIILCWAKVSLFAERKWSCSIKTKVVLCRNLSVKYRQLHIFEQGVNELLLTICSGI